ncbi:MAG: KaiC domain-containing protein [Natrialbaceae archaeon]
MSSDWFEDALSELDEEIDEEDIEREALAEELDEAVDGEDGDDVGPEETVAAGSVDEEETDEETVDTDTDGESEADVFGFSTDDGGGESTNSSSTAQTPEEFGFDSEDIDRSDERAGTAEEFDADTDEESVDPFGFDGEDPESDDEELADAGGDDDQSASSPTSTDTPEPGGSSTAQSPEEFGFSLDDGTEPTGDTTEAAADPTQTASASDADDPFGFGSSGDAGGGGGSTPSLEGSGDDDFGFGGFGGGGGGGGGPGGSSPEEFDDEEFDSDIDRIDLGIEGLDDMILGGVPERSLIGIIGGAGTGKTTFALQFLNEALKNGERAVFITLEQTEEAVLSTAEEKGWPFREYVEDDQLVIVVLDPVEMANSLASIRGDISRLIREFGASRLVLDSVSLLEMMYDHPAKRRSEVFDFTRSLKEAGVTTLLTSEASEDSSHASRYGAVEYLTDAVFILRYVRTSNFEETRLAIEIQKIRDANHSRATKPYDLTDEGMSVHRQANIF